MSEEVIQRWECPKCGGIQDLFVSATIVECARRHPARLMHLIVGEPLDHPPQVKQTVVRSRPKAEKVTTLDQLRNLFTEKEQG